MSDQAPGVWMTSSTAPRTLLPIGVVSLAVPFTRPPRIEDALVILAATDTATVTFTST